MNPFFKENDCSQLQAKKCSIGVLKAKVIKSEIRYDILEPVDLDWAFVYTNNDLENITKTTSISNFCKTQHLKYISHVTRLSNDSLQKQVRFSCEHKRYAHDRWLKFEKQLNIPRDQIQHTMQNKKEFTSLLNYIYR